MKHSIIVAEGEKYGAMYFLSSEMEANLDEFGKIWEKIDKSKKELLTTEEALFK
ncbi:MAG: hypothetical protein Q7J10_08785 [Methanosarcinaceae archaeon]|nr:hypothetical protein [Methanosarcinaceae archaeon]